ncbi:MAG: hypothetical protein L6E13_06405 [Firmicutes bacterium]|nr:hypothetical protein [Bacillota bacterium]
MFVCSGCQQHARDEDLRFTLLHHSRANHPSKELFFRRFDSRDCLVQFLDRLERHADRYILTDLTGPEPVEYGPALPRELKERLMAASQQR